MSTKDEDRQMQAALNLRARYRTTHVAWTTTARQMLEQSRRAAHEQHEMHEKLLAAGWAWDGMDGYYLPASFPKTR